MAELLGECLQAAGLGVELDRFAEGRQRGSWHFQGMLYNSAGPYEGWGAACGYPTVLRLVDGQLLCVFHTDFVDGDCQIRAVRLREKE